MKITVNDIRKAGICASGLKSFCQTHHLDLQQLFQHGWNESVLTNIDDLNVKKVLEVARGRS